MNTLLKNEVIGYPFVDHVNQESRPAIEDAQEFLERAYVPFFTNNDNLLRLGVYKLMGYEYNFKPYLKKYIYKQYGQYREVYAPNKTKLRKTIYGKIDRIIEIK